MLNSSCLTHSPLDCLLRELTAYVLIAQGIEIHPDCRDLLARMLVVDPKQRLSMQQIKQHKWY